VSDRTDFRLVDRQADLEALARRLRGVQTIAVDFEGEYNLHRYGIHLCLVQIADGEAVHLVDPVTLGSLAPLGPVLADERVTKVMCSADEDVKLIKRAQGIALRGIFDLQVAARLLGMGTPGLGRIIERVLGRTMEKKEVLQRSDWNRRPLSPAQLDYAAEDVRHLLPAWRLMRDALAAGDRLARAEELSRALEKREFRADSDAWMRLRGARGLSEERQHTLAALHAARERIAETLDLPPYRVVGNDALVAAARRPPASRDNWLRLVAREAWPFVDRLAAACAATDGEGGPA
jgi:ribonuclease D